MYQQTPDQRLDIVSHVHRSGVTGGQLDQRYQEVLALLHTFQRLLLVKYLVVTSHLSTVISAVIIYSKNSICGCFLSCFS